MTDKTQQKENKQNPAFSKEELEHFRQLLLDRREDAVRELERMRGQLEDVQERVRESSAYSSDLADGATGSREREELYIMIARQNKYVGHLDRALERIKNGTYGICKVTGKTISKERLEIVPHTTTSIEAKRRQS